MGNLHAVYEDLGEFLTGNLDEAAVRAILGIAAALAGVGADGRGVDGAEWAGACACAGARYGDAIFERVVDRPVARSIAERGEDGRGGVVSVEQGGALAGISADEKRWGRDHGACGRVVAKMHAGGSG